MAPNYTLFTIRNLSKIHYSPNKVSSTLFAIGLRINMNVLIRGNSRPLISLKNRYVGKSALMMNANLTNFLFILFANYTRIPNRKYAHSMVSVSVWTFFVMPLRNKFKKSSAYLTFAKHIRLMRIAVRILESPRYTTRSRPLFPFYFPTSIMLSLYTYSDIQIDIIVWIDRTSRLLSTTWSFSRGMCL